MTSAAGVRFERLSTADAANIAIDAPDQVNAFLMAGVLAPGGAVAADGSVDLDALRSAIAERLPRLTRLRERVRHDGRLLVWEPVSPDLAHHVRVAEPVAGIAGLESLCARLIVTPLPPDRPLWELIVVPGVAPARAGIVLRIHHAIADGYGAVRLAEVLFDAADASNASAVSAASVNRSTNTREQSSSRRSPFTAQVRMLASGLRRTATMLVRRAPRTILLGRISPRRGIGFAEVDLGALAAGARTVGATVNDALLVAVATAVTAALGARGEPVPAALSTSVPVALAHRDDSGNAVGVMLVDLPTRETDVGRRLRHVAGLTSVAKQDARSRGTFELTRTRFGARLFMRLARHQRLIVMFVSNVPGPRHPLALAGARLERLWPVTAIQGNVRLGVTAISYDGVLRCAVHCDADALDAAALAADLHHELAGIAALV
ncbi:wax ester/triacylglycerol synthase domain-containing protein [Agromyces humatus]|uniref:diacylglycerol O-acyltransferase n=1 Tax=Agromyces humatus TaxID=279573 RepID=A0ABN2KIP4_9MICO|nr:wax ester/triacylglycerol synthase domain-containing protein [Agromyces humatus]